MGGLVVLGAVWLAITALLVRSELEDLNDRFQRLRYDVAAGDIAHARKVAADIPAVAERVHDLTTGPAWWTASQVPYFGRPIEVTRGTATATARIGTDVVPQLMKVAKQIDPNTVRTSGSTVDLAPLARSAPDLMRASRSVDAAVRALHDLPTSTWIGPVDRGRAKIESTMQELRGYIDAAARVTRVLPGMLGEQRPQRYFIGLQNEAELRGTGGLPGAFAIAVANKGKLTFTRFESNARLHGDSGIIDTGLSFGKDYTAAYGASVPTKSFVNSNASPDFRYAAQIWAAMWQKVSGERVDGVLALDPTVLSYFLAATGPAKVKGGAVITAQNVVSLLQRDEYSLFANDFLQRKQFIVDVLAAASHKFTSGSGSGLGLLQAATLAASQRRLLAWSRDPVVEKAIIETDYGGTLPTPDVPFAGLVLNNASGGKIDFYLTRQLDYVRTGCGSTRDVVATIKLTNNAPEFGLPVYVSNRADRPPQGAQPGDVHQIVDFYASRGAQLLGVTLNGRRASAGIAQDLGRPLFRIDLEIPRGSTQTIELHLREPAGDGRSAAIWRQPGVTPLQVQSQQQSCG